MRVGRKVDGAERDVSQKAGFGTLGQKGKSNKTENDYNLVVKRVGELSSSSTNFTRKEKENTFETPFVERVPRKKRDVCSSFS